MDDYGHLLRLIAALFCAVMALFVALGLHMNALYYLQRVVYSIVAVFLSIVTLGRYRLKPWARNVSYRRRSQFMRLLQDLRSDKLELANNEVDLREHWMVGTPAARSEEELAEDDTHLGLQTIAQEVALPELPDPTPAPPVVLPDPTPAPPVVLPDPTPALPDPAPTVTEPTLPNPVEEHPYAEPLHPDDEDEDEFNGPPSLY